jgi:hypothetical protein
VHRLSLLNFINTRIQKMKKLNVILGGLALAMAASFASAGNIGLDEGALAQTGTISYDGIGGGLVGTDIIFSTILGTDTLANDGSALTCTGCLLNFITGANVSEGAPTWEFNGGGAFAVTGTAFDGANQIATGVLMQGSFGGNSLVLGGNGSGLFVGLGADTKNDDLEAFFGYPADQAWNFAVTTLSIGSCNASGGAGGFTCGVLNADVNNVSQVPIAGTWALMPLGLFGMGLMRRRAVV